MHRINEPSPVENAEPITVLESALIALKSDNSKSVHLSPRQAKAVLDEIDKWQAKSIIISLDYALLHGAAEDVLRQHTENSKSLAELREVTYDEWK